MTLCTEKQGEVCHWRELSKEKEKSGYGYQRRPKESLRGS